MVNNIINLEEIAGKTSLYLLYSQYMDSICIQQERKVRLDFNLLKRILHVLLVQTMIMLRHACGIILNVRSCSKLLYSDLFIQDQSPH